MSRHRADFGLTVDTKNEKKPETFRCTRIYYLPVLLQQKKSNKTFLLLLFSERINRVFHGYISRILYALRKII